MQKIFLTLTFLIMTLQSHTTIEPLLAIDINGTVKDMVVRKNKLIIGTDNGRLEVYEYKKRQFNKTIILPKIKDFMDDMIFPKVFSVDEIDNSYLLLSDSGQGGYANLWIYKDNHLTQLLSEKDKKPAIKARFIDKEHILLGFLSNEVSLFDIKNKKELYLVQLNESKFSDFALNEDKSKAVFSCESGVLNIIETKTGKLVKELKGLNVDNIYKVDFKKDTISGAGQDRRASIYNVSTGKGAYITGSFLIYATGLSPSTNRVAFAMDEKNNISIYNRLNRLKIAELKGQKSTLNNIIFKDENVLFSSSDDNTIFMWKLN